METKLAKKQSIEEMRINDFARYQFIVAMSNCNIFSIAPLLAKNARFMEYMSYYQLLDWFTQKFENLKKLSGQSSPAIHSNYDELISVDVYPGSVVMSFTYITYVETHAQENCIMDEFPNEGGKFMERQLNIKLVVVFEQGKIADIRLPCKIIAPEKAREWMVCN